MGAELIQQLDDVSPQVDDPHIPVGQLCGDPVLVVQPFGSHGLDVSQVDRPQGLGVTVGVQLVCFSHGGFPG